MNKKKIETIFITGLIILVIGYMLGFIQNMSYILAYLTGYGTGFIVNLKAIKSLQKEKYNGGKDTVINFTIYAVVFFSMVQLGNMELLITATVLVVYRYIILFNIKKIVQ